MIQAPIQSCGLTLKSVTQTKGQLPSFHRKPRCSSSFRTSAEISAVKTLDGSINDIFIISSQRGQNRGPKSDVWHSELYVDTERAQSQQGITSEQHPPFRIGKALFMFR